MNNFIEIESKNIDAAAFAENSNLANGLNTPP